MGKINAFSVRNIGSIIEVKLRDHTYTPFYIGKARVEDPKDMKRLIEELKQKGVNFSNKSWFK